MPTTLDIDSPVQGQDYSAMEMIGINGNHSGLPAASTKVWVKVGAGNVPTAYETPFEAGASDNFVNVSTGIWTSSEMITGNGLLHVRVWCLRPGQSALDYRWVTFTMSMMVLGDASFSAKRAAGKQTAAKQATAKQAAAKKSVAKKPAKKSTMTKVKKKKKK